MRIGPETSSWHIATRNTAARSQSAATRDKSTSYADANGDSVEISDEARAMRASGAFQTVQQEPLKYYTGQSTEGSLAGIGGKKLNKYLNGAEETGLTALNAGRKSLGDRIDTIIKRSGIKLGRDEKLTISVNARNEVVVGGIKDKKKAEAIQKALNGDAKLGRELRKHTATVKIAEYAKRQEAYEKQMADLGVNVVGDLGEDTDDAFTNRGMRSFVIEEYLQDKAGLGLADLSLEKGADGSVSILGMNSELNALLSEDAELGATIANILENGEATAGFTVSFEFANGAISDAGTNETAKSKIAGVQAILMGGVDPATGEQYPGLLAEFRDTITANMDDVDEELMKFLDGGFSIRVAADGSYEILGAGNLDIRYRSSLEALVDKALEMWADPTKGDVASFSDVAGAFIEQHRFEHGDVDEYAHMVDINFSGSPEDAKVVSPEADRAQDEANREVAGKLGDQLRAMLDEQGVDASGLEFEIDETGKITVLGDPENAETAKAQSIIDQFTQETKALAGGATKSDPATDEELDKERRRVRNGEDTSDAEQPPDGFGKRDVVATGEPSDKEKWAAFVKEHGSRIKPFLDDPTLEDPRSKYVHDVYVGWQRNLPRDMEGGHYISNVKPVSSIKAPQYAQLFGPGGGLVSPLAEGDNAGAVGKAREFYLQLLDGMTQFHDEKRKVEYAF